MPASLELVINRFVEKAELAVMQAQQKATEAVANLIPDTYEA